MSESPASPTPTPVHSYSPGTLVYEVNLSVPRDKVDEYIEWLKGFTKVRERETIQGYGHVFSTRQEGRFPRNHLLLLYQD